MDERALKVLEYNKITDRLSQMALSPMGRELAEGLLPSSSLSEVRMMQQETEEAVSIVLRKGDVPFQGLNDIRGSVKKVSKGSMLEPSELLKVADQMRCARLVKAFISGDIGTNFPMIDDLAEGLAPLKGIEDRIYGCIAGEEEISDRASVTLYNIRRKIREKNGAVRDKLNAIIKSPSYAKALQDPIITVRGDRFVVPVKSDHRSDFPGLVHDQSSSGSTLFIEPMSVVEMNNDIKELKGKEKAEIERILWELTQKIGDSIDSVGVNNDILGDLDFIFSKARMALEMKCMPPKINDDGYINIKKGRHPLIPGDKVVPNTILLGEDYSILVITGPNTGGKTVILKTLGLLTLMAEAGLQIPAEEGSEISVFDNVFADIGDEQSIEQSLSTFSSHMTNIVNIMGKVSKNSLVLLDELGAGTDPTEGAALAMAILDRLHSIGAEAAATTHYSELKAFALQRSGMVNASVEFDVETLCPTYKLLIGIPGKSNAFEISQRLGLERDIVDKAREYMSSESLEFEDLISNLQKDKIVAESDRQEAEIIKRDALKLKSEYQSSREKLNMTRESILNEARTKAKRMMRDAKDEADELVREIRRAADERDQESRNRRIEEARNKFKSRLDGIEDDIEHRFDADAKVTPVKDVKPGDTVFVRTLNQSGTVISPPDGKGEVEVQVGIMKINAKISDLGRKESAGTGRKQNSSSVRLTLNRSKTVAPEIDLRGQTLDEAIINVDKYLDDAYLSSLGEVTIIHGKGTGVLRQGITDMLKKHSHVKSFRPGKYGEGGYGVTVVEIDM